MNIPNYASDQFTDTNGMITAIWSNVITQIIQELQINLSNEGFNMPKLPTTAINKLTSATKSTGAIVYDSTTNQFKGNVNGTWKVFTLT